MTIKQVITLQAANVSEYTTMLTRVQAWMSLFPGQIESVTGKQSAREVTVVGKPVAFVFDTAQ